MFAKSLLAVVISTAVSLTFAAGTPARAVPDILNVTTDVVAAYRGVLSRGSKEGPAYQAAVRAYKRHHPTVSDRAARQAVDRILKANPQGPSGPIPLSYPVGSGKK